MKTPREMELAMAESVDVVVIGMGPGGESVAGELARAGLAVIGIESRLVGGECPYCGCIPSKMMIRAANALTEARRVPALAGSATAQADFRIVADRIRAEGLTEQQARESGLTISTAVSAVPSSSRGWIHKAGNEGVIKLVADTDRGVLIGATSAGPTGGEVLSMLTLAVHAELPISTLRQMIYAYPTFHRAVEAALDELP